MAILPRYVLVEITKVFLVSVTALTMLVLIVFVAREATQQNLPLGPVLRLMPYLLPDALRVAVPVTLLLACTTVFARMAGANEIVAVKALGISPMVLLWPVFVLSFLLSLVTVWLNDIAVSWGRSGIQRIAIEAVEEIAYSMLQSQRRYSSPFFSINVKRVEGRRLIRPTLTLLGKGNTPTTTIDAEEAELRSDRAEGVLKIFLRNGTVDMGGRISAQFPGWEEKEIPLSDASRSQAAGRMPSQLPLRLIPEEITQTQARIEQCEQEMAAQAAYQMLCGDFNDLAGSQWQACAAAVMDHWGRLYRLAMEPPRRWSAGFSCLCFVLVGAPMAIRLRNRDFLTSFFLCFLPILVVYYPLLAYSVDAAKNGSIPPSTVWIGNVLLVIWGVLLLRKVVRY